MSNYCEKCQIVFKRKSHYESHLKSKRHINGLKSNTFYHCECGKSYRHNQSLWTHQQRCKALTDMVYCQEQLERLEKEREEMKAQIALLMDKHATSNTTNNIETNIESQTNNNNIHIHINAFGQENIDYLDNNAVIACIERVYKSIPALIEKIHFDPEHPENHNIKITNKKLPYASVMGDNSKWKTVDRKDAIETMVVNGYNLLDEKYSENKSSISSKIRSRFKGFQDKFEHEDKELMKQMKTEVDLMVINGSSS